MILSVTPNTTFDQAVFIPHFEKGATIRALKTAQGLGGKPTDASWILGEMGIGSLALGFKAGPIGGMIEHLLHQKNVTTDFIEVGGSSRINTLIVVESEGWTTTITTLTLEVSPDHLDQLWAKIDAALDQASVLVTGGTLPAAMSPTFYTDLIRMARERGVPVVFDAAEPNLSAGLRSSPTYCKPNQDELSQVMGKPIHTIEEAYQAGRALYEQYGTCPIITLGEDGGLAVLPDHAYRIPGIKVDVVATGGAGDGVLAGITASIHLGQPIEDGLRLGFAAATAVILQPRTADCKREDVEHFLSQVALIPYPSQSVS